MFAITRFCYIKVLSRTVTEAKNIIRYSKDIVA